MFTAFYKEEGRKKHCFVPITEAAWLLDGNFMEDKLIYSSIPFLKVFYIN